MSREFMVKETLTVDAGTTADSTTVTGNFLSGHVGMDVYGTGIPDVNEGTSTTVVVSVVEGVSAELSRAATATGSPTLTLIRNSFGDVFTGWTQDAMTGVVDTGGNDFTASTVSATNLSGTLDPAPGLGAVVAADGDAGSGDISNLNSLDSQTITLDGDPVATEDYVDNAVSAISLSADLLTNGHAVRGIDAGDNGPGIVQTGDGSEFGGGPASIGGGTGATGLPGGDANLVGGAGNGGLTMPANVTAQAGLAAVPGRLLVTTNGSTGTIGQVLTSDGAGGVVWADLP